MITPEDAPPATSPLAYALQIKERLQRVFFPYDTARLAEVKQNDRRFVYYTSAETAMRILQSGEIWMRNASTMNDFAEVHHGFDRVNSAWKGESGAVLRGTLDSCFAGVAKEIQDLFNSLWPSIQSNTFLTCISEHHDTDDLHGRLSMWRGYGADCGVALVVNGNAMFKDTSMANVFGAPVLYADDATFAQHFLNLAKGVQAECDLLTGLGRDAAKQLIFTMLRFMVVCIKHPGFAEEREWRVIASPGIEPEPSVPSAIEAIDGVPQRVLKLKLQAVAPDPNSPMPIPALLNRVIIGPCDYPVVTLHAFMALLEQLGVPNARDKVFVSGTPLRTRRR
jgi:hypothetical protein